MFLINTNKSIKISCGDDSGKFPLFLNKGTTLTPIRYEFDYDIVISSPQFLERIYILNLNKLLWLSKYLENGIHSFRYLNSKWYYSEKEVNLSEYGITYEGDLENEDTIVVTQSIDSGEYIYFYIFDTEYSTHDFLIKKIFEKNGTITTLYKWKPTRVEVDENLINENGDILLRIDSEDTADLEPGEYFYLILAEVKNLDDGNIVLNTVTNRLPFYVIEDQFDRGMF